jgi:hypothetical protein
VSPIGKKSVFSLVGGTLQPFFQKLEKGKSGKLSILKKGKKKEK